MVFNILIVTENSYNFYFLSLFLFVISNELEVI